MVAVNTYNIKEKAYTANIKSVQVQGSREYQEDEYLIKHIPKHIVLAGIFDGHGGGYCSKWVKTMVEYTIEQNLDVLHKKSYKRLLNKMLESTEDQTPTNYTALMTSLRKHYKLPSLYTLLEMKDTAIKLHKINDFLYEHLLKNSIQDVSEKWDEYSIPRIGQKKRNKYTSGTTLLISLIVGFTVHLIWVGDSRTIFTKDSIEGVFSTKDHKPTEDDLPDNSDGFIHNNRINGILGVGRTIGDNSRKLRGCITRDSSYVKYKFTKKTSIVMASDGLYDMSSNAESMNIALNTVKSEDYSDNMTMIRIDIEHT
jgi:serine/threonine protein phosphatase PrpC